MIVENAEAFVKAVKEFQGCATDHEGLHRDVTVDKGTLCLDRVGAVMSPGLGMAIGQKAIIDP